MLDIESIQNEIRKETKLDLKFAAELPEAYLRIKTGMPMLDYVLGGGMPRNAVTLIHGEASTGKTFITQRVIATAQQNDLACAFIDVEHAWDNKWAETIGVDKNKLLVFQPHTAEDALDIAELLCEKRMDIVVLDSIAALLPAAEAEGSMEDQQVGLQARLLNKFFRKVSPNLENTALMIINQRRVNVGGWAPHGQTAISLPGGKAQEFVTKIILETRRTQYLYNNASKKGDPFGFTLKLKATKNKTSIPYRECEIPINFSGEIDLAGEIFDLAKMYGIIKQGGPYYSYGDQKVQGRDGFIRYMEENDLTVQIEADVEARIRGESNE